MSFGFADSEYFRQSVPARFPARWNHLAEKESRQINMLEQILVGEVMQLRRDLLQGNNYNSSCCN